MVKRILIADDIKEVLDSIHEMLSPYYEVDTVMSGFDVLQLFEQKSYDCIILDINFEFGISGLEVGTILRSYDKNVSILIFSAIDYDPIIRQQVVDMGAVFCEKPLSLDFIHKILGEERNE